MDKNIILQNKEWIDGVWEKIDKKLSGVAVKSRGKIPYTTIDGVHDDKAKTDISWWTNGFWPGMMWLMYIGTGNEEYRKTAEITEEIMDANFEAVEKLHHDVGFMWHIMSGASYRITGNKKSRNRNLLAAALLASRYNIDGKFIRAWNDDWYGKNVAGWSIIDCMMNIPLLYWASEEIGDTRFKKIAMSHADMALKDHIRPDGSVNHIVEHDTDNGDFIRSYGGQGYDENSCWSRGLAWAVYGSVLSYKYTGENRYLNAAIKTADYFIANVCAYNYRTPVDFRAPLSPEYVDSTAGLCTACGLLELSKYVSEAESRCYTAAAINILKATDSDFCDYELDDDALVKMGTERYPLNGNLNGVHIPIIYGDFFLVEAMLKLKGEKFLIW